MKLIRRVVLGVILLIIIAVTVVIFSLDGVIRSTIESQGTQQLKLQTTLSSAHLGLLGGDVSLKDLEIGSPEGFKAPKMFTLGGVDVGVSYGQLRGNPVHVKSIVIDKPLLVIERGPDGSFNFKKAADDMPKGETSNAPSSSGKSSGGDMKLIIDELTIKDAAVKLRPGIPGMPEEIPVNIATFTMKNVGTGDGASNGAAVKDVVMQIITAIAGHATASGGLTDQLKGMLNSNLSSTMSQLSGEAQKQLGNILPGDIGKNVSGLLNNPKGALPDPSKLLNLGGGSGGATSQPSAPAGIDPGKALQGLLGGKKDK